MCCINLTRSIDVSARCFAEISSKTKGKRISNVISLRKPTGLYIVAEENAQAIK